MLALLFAGFVPLLLAGVGALPALIAGRIESEATEAVPEQTRSEPQAVPEQIKPFVCSECGKRYAKQQGLNAHMRAHPERSNGHKQLQHAQVRREQ